MQMLYTITYCTSFAITKTRHQYYSQVMHMYDAIMFLRRVVVEPQS